MGRSVSLLIAFAGLALCAPVLAADSAPDAGRFDTYQARKSIPAQLKQVAADLYFFYEDAGSNSAFLVTDEGVLVIDTRQHPVLGRDLIARIRKVTDKPIKWVVVTHAHGDHYYGNPAFKAEGATIIAHKDTMAGMIKNESIEFRRRQSFFKARKFDPNEVKTILPDVTFDSSLTLTLGGRRVEIFYWGPGQNPGDTMVHFPHARALYVGGPFARRNWSNMSFTPSVDGEPVTWNRPGPTHISFNCKDTDRWHDYLKSKGVEIVSPPQRSPHGHTFFFAADPDGNLIEMIDIRYLRPVLRWLGALGGPVFKRTRYRQYFR